MYSFITNKADISNTADLLGEISWSWTNNILFASWICSSTLHVYVPISHKLYPKNYFMIYFQSNESYLQELWDIDLNLFFSTGNREFDSMLPCSQNKR